jgi:hypothetical protein
MVVPVHFAISGDSLQVPVALGDLRFCAKIGLMRHSERLPLDVAVVADLELPTGAGWAYVGAQRSVAQLGVAVRGDPLASLAIAGEIGVRSGTGARLGDYVVGPELTYGLGASLQVNRRLWLGAEWDGAWSFFNGSLPGATPLEFLGTVRGHIGRHVQLTAGGGGGMTAGIGAPKWRVILGLAWLPGYPEAGLQGDTELSGAEEVTRSRLLIRVLGPDGEAIQGARVTVENTDVSGETNGHGLFEHALDSGAHFVGVTFPGRDTVFREFSLDRDGVTDITVVLFPSKTQDIPSDITDQP